MNKSVIEELFTAIAKKDKNTVEKYLNEGFDVNQIDEFGDTPLLYAANSTDRVEMVRLLIEHGADLNVKTKPGYTACHLAVLSNNFETLKLLIDHGADRDIVDPYGNSLLSNAVGHYSDKNGDEIVRYLLLDLNMNPSQKNNHDKSALDLFDMPKNEPIRHLFEQWL